MELFIGGLPSLVSCPPSQTLPSREDPDGAALWTPETGGLGKWGTILLSGGGVCAATAGLWFSP